MAYVLGFFAADGAMVINPRGSHYIDFTIADKELLESIRESFGSNHFIKICIYKNKAKYYRLQIGSKKMFNNLLRLGMTPRKSLTLQLPRIPDEYFAHFVRGYFDGDENVSFGFYKKTNRIKKSAVLLTRFTSGSFSFLKSLQKKLTAVLYSTGSLSGHNTFWQLSYSKNDSFKISNFMYGTQPKKLLYLKRKYIIYKEAYRVMGR